MRITVIGATGMIGSEVTAEAARRGHDVTAASRHPTPSRHPADTAPVRVTSVAVDAGDRAAVKALLAAADVAVLAVRPAPGQEDTLPQVTRTVLDAGAATRTRILVVGGSGPLWSHDRAGLLVVDDPDRVPPAYRAIALASARQLQACKAHDGTDWTYLSPPAEIGPGERTGTFRRGTDTLLTAADGQSRISVQDFAIAAIDELEHSTGMPHITVAY